MAKTTKQKPDQEEQPIDVLAKQYTTAWDALVPLRQTWTEKEQALLAKANDSFTGNIVKGKITDASLSTLAFERQARVAAQLSTGKVYPAGKKDEGKARLANIVLQRYIIPNANSQKNMLVKQRLWGVYASVYGSMPMLYDYRVDDDYIGPDCWLIDPRMFLPQPGRNSIQESEWAMVSTIVTRSQVEEMANKKKTNWNIDKLKQLLKASKDGKPSRYNDSDKDSETSSSRYDKSLSKDEIELVTKYESGEAGHWLTFAPDYKDVGILRDIANPHKSAKIPIVIRDCFPLLNSIYGLGDFERGMKIQKAKDSLLGLRLEFAKNKVFPPLKINTKDVTVSTIKYGAGRKWLVSDMNAVQAQTFGNESDNAFQSVFSVLNTIQQNQFGTTDTSVSKDDSANAQYGKTPQALKMLEQRENARDTWDRFMHEQAVQDLYEGMINLLSSNIEKPINFTIFEEEVRQIAEEYGNDVLQILDRGKLGAMTVSKKNINTDKGYTYVVDANSSLAKDDKDQLDALTQTYMMAAQDPNLQMALQQQGIKWDQAEHFKRILINSGVTDWERILQEGQAEPMAAPDQGVPEQVTQEQPMPEETAQPVVQQVPQFNDPDVQEYAQIMFGDRNG